MGGSGWHVAAGVRELRSMGMCWVKGPGSELPPQALSITRHARLGGGQDTGDSAGGWNEGQRATLS